MKKYSIILIFLMVAKGMGQLANTVDYPEFGLRFTIPEGWVGQTEGDFMVLGHSTFTGVMVLFENMALNAQELKQLAEQDIHEEGVVLNAVGDFTIQKGNKVQGRYEGTFNGAQVKALGIGLINGLGNGLNIIILDQKDQFSDTHIAEAQKLAASVKFYKARDSEATLAWKYRIVGSQLKYMYSSGGYDGEGAGHSVIRNISIDLCSSGSFYYNYEDTSHYDTGRSEDNQVFAGGHKLDDGYGNYRIYTEGKETYLELLFAEGKVLDYTLALKNEEEALLNGERYFITKLENCN